MRVQGRENTKAARTVKQKVPGWGAQLECKSDL
jgi:hypothetical protein